MKSLLRLGGCLGWSENSLGAYVILLILSCCSSNNQAYHHTALYHSIPRHALGVWRNNMVQIHRRRDCGKTSQHHWYWHPESCHSRCNISDLNMQKKTLNTTNFTIQYKYIPLHLFTSPQNSHSSSGFVLKHQGSSPAWLGLLQRFFAASIELSGKLWSTMYHCCPVRSGIISLWHTCSYSASVFVSRPRVKSRLRKYWFLTGSDELLPGNDWVRAQPKLWVYSTTSG